MPIQGTLDVATALAAAPRVRRLSTEAWELQDVTFVQVNWECEHTAALPLTPPALHPSIPPYVAALGMRVLDSPVGPFSLAQMRLVVRAGIRPRGYCLGAVCDSDAAAEALREGWGYPVSVGEVHVATRHDRIFCTAAVDGREVMEIAVGDPEPIAGADLLAFDNLHLIRLGEGGEGVGSGAIVQVNPEYAIHSADRGRPVLRLPDANALGMRGGIRLTLPMTAFAFRADTTLPPVRFVMDPVELAVQSTRKVEAAAV
jgi:hypothetical protein